MNHLTEKGRLRLRLRLHPIALAAAAFALASHCAHAQHSSTALPAVTVTATLSEQDAWDVATYLNSQERPQDPRFTQDVATTRAQYASCQIQRQLAQKHGSRHINRR